jgi:hypothetical protein
MRMAHTRSKSPMDWGDSRLRLSPTHRTSSRSKQITNMMCSEICFRSTNGEVRMEARGIGNAFSHMTA